MLCSGGCCDSSIATRCCVAWGKFQKLFPLLTSRHLSPKAYGKVCMGCVCLAMLHSSETFRPYTTDLERPHCNDCAKTRWICGTKDQGETSAVSLLQTLGIKGVMSGWDGMDSMPNPITNRSETYRFMAPEGEEGEERCGLNVYRLIFVDAVWLALTRKAMTLAGKVFGVAWCIPSHWPSKQVCIVWGCNMSWLWGNYPHIPVYQDSFGFNGQILSCTISW